MPDFITRVRDFLTGNQKDTLPVDRYEGFTANGALSCCATVAEHRKPKSPTLI
jgi:hypothetical protein